MSTTSEGRLVARSGSAGPRSAAEGRRAGLIDAKFGKWITLVAGITPAVILLTDAFRGRLGVDEVNFAIRSTGKLGLVFLLLSLLVTPIRRLARWNGLIAIRRNLGVLGFSYILTHFAIYFWWDRGHDVGSTFDEIISREYLWYGFGALVAMIPLAVTSTDGMVRRLGAKRWKALHRLAYPIVIAGIIHYWQLQKSDVRLPEAAAIYIGVLLAYRVVMHHLDLRRDLRDARAKLSGAKAAPTPKKFWSGELEIARIFDETHDVKTFRFVAPGGGMLPFQHIAGQYINLNLTIDGKCVNRSYTIASSPTRNAYCEISVKRAENGYASKHLHDTWREGMRIKVAAPAGKFVFGGHEADRVVLVAGGIGITPMMSVVRCMTDRGWKGPMYLLFSVKKVKDVVFERELAYLQERFPNLHVLVTVTNDAETAWCGSRGQITREMVERFVPDLKHGPVMLCGPDPMMTAMRALFVAIGVPDAEIHQEAFISPPPLEAPATNGEVAANGVAPVPLEPGEVASIRFERAGKSAELTSEATVLECAEDNGVEIPFECRSGICGQCKTKLISGAVAMEVSDALSPADRKNGLILACQARAARDLVIDA